MPSPTTATLSGPTSGECSNTSASFTVTLDQPAGVGGVVVTVGDTGSDTITNSPFTIASGATTGTFTITPNTCGNRDISITTSPALTIAGSPITYDSLCACPDDTGATSSVLTWNTGTTVCPAAFSVTVNATPSDLDARSLYCSSSSMSFAITE